MKTMLKVDHVSISYKIGDFKDIGLKEWTMRHLKNQYHVETFMAVEDVSFELLEGDHRDQRGGEVHAAEGGDQRDGAPGGAH